MCAQINGFYYPWILIYVGVLECKFRKTANDLNKETLGAGAREGGRERKGLKFSWVYEVQKVKNLCFRET